MTNCRPLMFRYHGQSNFQPAYLQINQYGEITTYYDENIGGGMSSDLWNGIDVRFEISNILTQSDIDELIEKVSPLATELLEESEIEFINGREMRIYTNKGDRIKEDIEKICREFFIDFSYTCDNEDCSYCYSNESY